MTDVTQITIEDLDANLRADLDADPSAFTAWEHVLLTEDGFVDGNRRLHVVHHAEAQRGGIVFVGSGSSGATEWTDASTPDEVLTRYLATEMSA